MNKKKFTVDLQIASDEKLLPHPNQFKLWVGAAVEDFVDCGEVTIRITDEEEIAELNSTYRSKNYATNVLSFPYEEVPGVASNFLGDIILCPKIINKEANDQGKEIIEYWAHMVVHGCLHLLGFDHETNEEAEEMEKLETNIIVNKLGMSSPYGDLYSTEIT